MWTDPWILIGGLVAAIVAGTAALVAPAAFIAGIMWNRRRAARVQEFEAAYAAGLAARPEPGPKQVDQVARTRPPAGLFTPQQPTAPTLTPVKSHADPTRTRVSTTVGKRWKPGTQHTTAMPAVTPEKTP